MGMRVEGRERRRRRVRRKISGTPERPRMSVFKSARHICAQIIDDTAGKTLAAASTYEKQYEGKKGTGNCASAKTIGGNIAERARQKGIESVVFDRGGYRYHGRVKALADAARQKGLKL